MQHHQQYTIVGLSYNLKGRAQHFLNDLWEHKWEVMLCHDTAYTTDPHAIAAIVGSELVGHVASSESACFWRYMEAMAQRQGVTVDEVTVYGEVVAVDRRDGVSEHVAFTVSADFEGEQPASVAADDVWQQWGEGLLALPTRAADVMYLNAVRSLRRMMASPGPANIDNAVMQLEAYRQLSRHELSLEHRQLLMEVTAWLLSHPDERMRAMGREYQRMDCAMNEEERVEERLAAWWPELLQCPEGERLWDTYRQLHAADYDPERLVGELLRHLEQLPGSLSANLGNGSEFFKGLYYQNTPRQLLHKVYGTIVICSHLYRQLQSCPSTLALLDAAHKPADTSYGQEQLSIPFSWMVDWATNRANESQAQTVRMLVEDYALSQHDQALVRSLDEMEHGCKPQLLVESVTIDQELNFNAPVAQAIANIQHLESSNTPNK